MRLDDLVKVNKDYFIKASTIAIKVAIFEALPYLNVPPFNFLINQVVNWLVAKLASSLELLAFFTYIDFRVDQQGREYVQAAHEAERVPTEEMRKKADEAFKRFAKFNNL